MRHGINPKTPPCGWFIRLILSGREGEMDGTQKCPEDLRVIPFLIPYLSYQEDKRVKLLVRLWTKKEKTTGEKVDLLWTSENLQGATCKMPP